MAEQRKMLYLVMIDNCEAYEDAYVYTATVVFKVRNESGDLERYGVDTRTFACHYLEFDFKLHFVSN